MNKAMKVLAVCGVVAISTALAACGGGGGSGHTQSLGGIGHRDGYTDPLTNCVGCHGADLHGGSEPSCYSCHNSDDHATVYSGIKHNQPDVDCTRCHGATRTRGGIGPACVGTGCHSV